MHPAKSIIYLMGIRAPILPYEWFDMDRYGQRSFTHWALPWSFCIFTFQRYTTQGWVLKKERFFPIIFHIPNDINTIRRFVVVRWLEGGRVRSAASTRCSKALARFSPRCSLSHLLPSRCSLPPTKVAPSESLPPQSRHQVFLFILPYSLCHEPYLN